jgi:hypothetical protein
VDSEPNVATVPRPHCRTVALYVFSGIVIADLMHLLSIPTLSDRIDVAGDAGRQNTCPQWLNPGTAIFCAMDHSRGNAADGEYSVEFDLEAVPNSVLESVRPSLQWSTFLPLCT